MRELLLLGGGILIALGILTKPKTGTILAESPKIEPGPKPEPAQPAPIPENAEGANIGAGEDQET